MQKAISKNVDGVRSGEELIYSAVARHGSVNNFLRSVKQITYMTNRKTGGDLWLIEEYVQDNAISIEENKEMDKLTVVDNKRVLTLDSRDVAKMVERDHNELLKSIRQYCEYLGQGEIPQSDFFTESSYVNSQNKTMPCYLITRKGCDMIANKMTGEKGVRFTATYVDRFYEMENALQNPVPKIMSPAELSLLQAQALVDIEKKQQAQQEALDAVNKRVDSIGDIISLNPQAWREEAQRMVTRIAKKIGGHGHIQDVYAEIYDLMLHRFGFDLKRRLNNKRAKMAMEGANKTQQQKVTRIDVIAEDKKMIEAYLTLIKEMAIKYGVDRSA
ncbi:Rha family transcriptional regulator [Eubacteriales bacterium OttesenSCG-928-A19]|nr:Rha family transcriptional regulator [Eubacteriales bacterium OttesenSCG-928-A19]